MSASATLQAKIVGLSDRRKKERAASRSSAERSADSAGFPASPQFQVQTAFAQHFEGVLDFVKKAYYVEATLVAPGIVAGHPAAISIIKVIAQQPDF